MVKRGDISTEEKNANTRTEFFLKWILQIYILGLFRNEVLFMYRTVKSWDAKFTSTYAINSVDIQPH